MRALVAARRVKLNGEVWLDDARRLKAGDTVEVLARAEKAPTELIDQIPIRYIDEHIVVVDQHILAACLGFDIFNVTDQFQVVQQEFPLRKEVGLTGLPDRIGDRCHALVNRQSLG